MFDKFNSSEEIYSVYGNEEKKPFLDLYSMVFMKKESMLIRKKAFLDIKQYEESYELCKVECYDRSLSVIFYITKDKSINTRTIENLKNCTKLCKSQIKDIKTYTSNIEDLSRVNLA